MRSPLPLALALLALLACARARTATRTPAVSTHITSLSDKDARTKAATHPAFANAGRQAGLEIWRIEDFEPVPVSASDQGKFYKGDSYIVLKTKADKRGTLSWDIHYWIGSESTQDESGAAAILTVGLDDKFNGAAIQHRETMGYESSQFTGYFQPAIRYLDGGHASGFHHVTTNAGAAKRLFQIKGKRNVRVRQVDPVISSMNKGDVFILDVDHDIYVYVGPKAKNVEKLKAISVANQIRDQDHNGRGKVEIVDQYSNEVDVQKFFTALGSGSKDLVPEDSAGGDDQQFERSEEQAVTLSEISDASGKIKITPLTKPFKQEQLKPQEVYILDTVSGSIYVWVGKQATEKEKSEAMTKAQEYLQAKKYPSWVHVMRIPQGTEPAVFKQYFSTWRDVGMSHSRLVRAAAYTEDWPTNFNGKPVPEDAYSLFIQYNNVPIGFEVYKDRVFLTVPRRRHGIPWTLNYFDIKELGSPLLKPYRYCYPRQLYCTVLVSVYRPRVDECGRLWAVDTGLSEVPGMRYQLTKPAIMVYNLTDNEEMRFDLDDSVLVNNRTTGGLTSITVDVDPNDCANAYAYINDLATEGMVVFSLAEKRSWRVTHPSFKHEESALNFTVAGHPISWPDGLFSIALSERDRAGRRVAYYHPLMSTNEFSVPTEELKRQSSAIHVKLLGSRGPLSQSGSHAYHAPTRTLFFANVAQDAIQCWQVDTELKPGNVAIVSQDHQKLVYISDLKIVGDEVWVLSNQMPNFVFSTLNVNETNFYILKARVQDLIKGTTCDSAGRIHFHYND